MPRIGTLTEEPHGGEALPEGPFGWWALTKRFPGEIAPEVCEVQKHTCFVSSSLHLQVRGISAASGLERYVERLRCLLRVVLASENEWLESPCLLRVQTAIQANLQQQHQCRL